MKNRLMAVSIAMGMLLIVGSAGILTLIFSSNTMVSKSAIPKAVPAPTVVSAPLPPPPAPAPTGPVLKLKTFELTLVKPALKDAAMDQDLVLVLGILERQAEVLLPLLKEKSPALSEELLGVLKTIPVEDLGKTLAAEEGPLLKAANKVLAKSEGETLVFTLEKKK